MEFKKKIGLGVLSLATILGSATAMLSSNTSSVSAAEETVEIPVVGSFNYYDKGNSFGLIANGTYIWNDGETSYYSGGDTQFVLNKETSTWSEMTWNGLESFYASGVWSDGYNHYYSDGNTQLVLDKETSTWSEMTWNGVLGKPAANGIWSDGDNVYYSYSGTHCILDKETLTWNTMTWNGLSDFTGFRIWTDGTTIYYSNYASQYKLNKETSTWEEVVWNGYTSFAGDNVWNVDGNIIVSSGYEHRLLDKETSTWNKCVFDYNNVNYNGFWSDGENYYHTKDFITLAFDYESDKLYSQSDLENARQEGADSVDVTSNDKEIYDKAFADGVASVEKVDEDVNNSIVDVEVKEEKENGFVSFMKWINKYIFFGLFGD